jgi:hypothetical protein
MWIRRTINDFTSLWVGGLALMAMTAVELFFRTNPSEARIPIYLTLGGAVSFCMLVFTLGSDSGRARIITESSLAAGCVLMSLPLLMRYSSAYALALAGSQCVVTLMLIQASSKRAHGCGFLLNEATPTSGSAWAAAFYVAAICWTILIQLLRGGSVIFGRFSFVGLSEFRAWTLATWSSVPVLCSSFALVLTYLFFLPRCQQSRRASRFSSIHGVRNYLALAVFAALSFRSDQWAGRDFLTDAYWHWSYFVWPAEDIRQGGWLLWDVPSWYGFGSILLISALPTKSCWQSMYLVNSSTLLFCAVLLYLVLGALRPGWIGWLFSFIATTACVFLLPGRADYGSGPQIWPSAAAFRFVWVYVLLAILWWGYRRFLRSETIPRGILLFGCLAWTLGVVWSLESAIYVTTVWMPAFALLVWHYAGESSRTKRQHVVAVLASFLVPACLLGAVGVGLAIYYWLVAGHVPDVSAFYEVAWAFRAFRDDWYTGSVGLWVLILVFCASSTTVVSLLRGQNAWTRAFAVSIWAALWSTGSYVVLKGDAATLLSASPIFATCLGLLLYIVDQKDMQLRLPSMVHATFASVMIVLLSLAFGNLPKLSKVAANVRVGYTGLAPLLSLLDEERLAVLSAAGVQPHDRVVILDEPGMLRSALRAAGTDGPFLAPWLPVRSWERMVYRGTVWNRFSPTVVPSDRMRQYVSRSALRARSGGYVLVDLKTEKNPAWSWFFDELRRHYVEEVVSRASDHLLLRYQSR